MIAGKFSAASQAREIGRRDLFLLFVHRDSSVLYADMKLDVGKCSLCGLCAENCANGAILAHIEEKIRIVFRSELCDGCGGCTRGCPEGCLRFGRALSLSGECESPKVLIEGPVARCSSCGHAFSSRALIERVRSELEAAGKHAPPVLCSACKSTWQRSGEK